MMGCKTSVIKVSTTAAQITRQTEFASDYEDGHEERRIWAAVLLQAIDDYQHEPKIFTALINKVRVQAQKNDTHKRALKRGVGIWFRSDDADVGCFVWICELLGIDPDVVRDKVLKPRVTARKAA